MIDAGTLELTAPETERETNGDILVFDPTRVVAGIELSDDPVLHVRSLVYSESVRRRTGIGRPAELDWERLTVPGEPGLALMVYTAPGTHA